MSYLESGECCHSVGKRAGDIKGFAHLIRPRKILITLPLLADLLSALDVAAIFISALIAKALYVGLFIGASPSYLPYAALGLLVACVNFAAMRWLCLYSSTSILNSHFPFAKILFSISLAFLLLLNFLFMLKISDTYSRIWIFSWYFLSYFAVITGRALVVRYLRRSAGDFLQPRIAVYGEGRTALLVRDQLVARSDECQFAGFYDSRPIEPTNTEGRGLQALIELGQLNLCDQIIIALPQYREQSLSSIVEKFSILPVPLLFCSYVGNIPIPVHKYCAIGNMQFAEVQRSPLTDRELLAKRALDFTLAVIGLVLLTPLALVVAIAIKLEDGGPVFFRQRRHGFNRSIISVTKFRTMTVAEDGDTIAQATANDTRVTKVGRILRRTSIDEIPQLLNVLGGQMSLVGPRPHALCHNLQYEKIVEKYANRHKVKPGITGLAQVHGLRGETRDPSLMRQRVVRDLEYIENWSVRLDFIILIRTVWVVVTGRAAY